jgi:hypothetical protein
MQLHEDNTLLLHSERVLGSIGDGKSTFTLHVKRLAAFAEDSEVQSEAREIKLERASLIRKPRSAI